MKIELAAGDPGQICVVFEVATILRGGSASAGVHTHLEIRPGDAVVLTPSNATALAEFLEKDQASLARLPTGRGLALPGNDPLRETTLESLLPRVLKRLPGSGSIEKREKEINRVGWDRNDPKFADYDTRFAVMTYQVGGRDISRPLYIALVEQCERENATIAKRRAQQVAAYESVLQIPARKAERRAAELRAAEARAREAADEAALIASGQAPLELLEAHVIRAKNELTSATNSLEATRVLTNATPETLAKIEARIAVATGALAAAQERLSSADDARFASARDKVAALVQSRLPDTFALPERAEVNAELRAIKGAAQRALANARNEGDLALVVDLVTSFDSAREREQRPHGAKGSLVGSAVGGFR